MSIKNEIMEMADGIYNVTTYSGELMRAEKHNGVWYWTDGTGWSEQVEYPEEIISVVKALV